jgi:hypothetical protein
MNCSFQESLTDNCNYNQFDFRPPISITKNTKHLNNTNNNLTKKIDDIIFHDMNCIFTNSNLTFF